MENSLDWNFILKNFGTLGVVIAVAGYLSYRGFAWYGTNILIPKRNAEVGFYSQLGQESKDRIQVMEKISVTLALMNKQLENMPDVVRDKISYFVIRSDKPVIISPEKKNENPHS